MGSMRSLVGAGVLAFGAMAVLAPAAQADIVIDDWSVDQGPFSQPSSNGITSYVSGSMIGGQRELVGNNGDDKSGGGYVMAVSGGKLRASFEPGRYAFVQASWRSYTGGFDLTEGGVNDRFRLASVNAARLTLAAYNWMVPFQLVYTGGAMSGSDVDVMFSSFEYYNYSTGEFRPATISDFQSILTMSVSSRTQDGEFPDGATLEVGTLSVVPTPSAAALLAVGGLAAVRRRR